MQKNKAVVADFDGTLVKINSFEKFYQWLFSLSVKRAWFSVAFELIWLIALRKVGIIRHEELKRKTLILYQSRRLSIPLNEFSQILCKHMNEEIWDVLDSYRLDNYKIVVSTAAPFFYVNDFINDAGLYVDGIVATEIPDDYDWHENQRDIKKDNTLRYLKKMDLTLNVLITDHEDDISLLIIPKERNILVNPSQKTLRKIKAENVEFDVL